MKDKYRFHLLSLVHLPQSKAYMSCAFTQKNRKMAKMMTDLGHEVFFYGSEGSDVEEYCNSDNLRFIQTHTLADIARDYGDGDNRFEVGYDWQNVDFRHDFNAERKPSTLKFYSNTIKTIGEIGRPDDFLLLSQGFYYKDIDDALKMFLTAEFGIGYRGSYPGHFRAFESAYMQNFTYGSEHPYGDLNGSYYDRVIPNYFAPADIEYSEDKDDYLLFIGRMIKRKGIMTADLVARALGKKLIIVGQGAHVTARGSLLPNNLPDFELEPGTWEYVGYQGVEERKRLMARARVTLTPTEYLECFAGTHVESMLSGTPVITTDFGVFPGTVVNGVNGFRCHTLNDFVQATLKAEQLQPSVVRASAEKYLMGNVAMEFQKWFDNLHDVYESAMDPSVKAWHRIN